MTKRLMQVFVAVGAMAMLAGAVEAKTTPVEISAVAEHSAAADRLARAIFIDPAVNTATQSCVAPSTAPAAAQERVTPLRLSPTIRQAEGAAEGADFASAAPSFAAANASRPDWGAVDAAYRGGPISTYGADASVGLGLRIGF
jgi:hypothetical protein